MAIVAIMASGLVGNEGKREGFLGICQIHHHLRSQVAERLEARAFHFKRRHTFIDKARVAFGAAHGVIVLFDDIVLVLVPIETDHSQG